MRKFIGTGASRGVAIGRLHFYDNATMRVKMQKAMDIEAERERFEQARLQAIETLGDLHQRAIQVVGLEDSIIFEIHQMMLDDRDYIDRVEQQLHILGCTAEYAVQLAGEQLAKVFALMEDNAYMQERASDVMDISNRVLRLLSGQGPNDFSDLEGRLVVAARDLLPSETIQMDKAKVQAFVMSGGSRISHAAILARTMGIPVVVGLCGQLSNLQEGEMVVVDGFSGVVVADPDPDTLAHYMQKQQEYCAYKERLKRLKGVESRTIDGTFTEICANISHPSEAASAQENDAVGISLFRTGFLYQEGGEPPSENAQYEAFRSVLTRMPDALTLIGTMDVAVDREPLPCRVPSLICADAAVYPPDQNLLLRVQLRALLRASVHGRLGVLFPMTVSQEDAREARLLLERCKAELDAEGIPYNRKILVGIMIDTPAAALISDLLAREADFFVIGLESLAQYTLASDRTTGRVGWMSDSRRRAVLRLVKTAVENAAHVGIWCGVCGETAWDRKLTEQFLRMGIRWFSVVPDSILEVREKIRSVNLSAGKPDILGRF